jgi:hypothetical protein
MLAVLSLPPPGKLLISFFASFGQQQSDSPPPSPVDMVCTAGTKISEFLPRPIRQTAMIPRPTAPARPEGRTNEAIPGALCGPYRSRWRPRPATKPTTNRTNRVQLSLGLHLGFHNVWARYIKRIRPSGFNAPPHQAAIRAPLITCCSWPTTIRSGVPPGRPSFPGWFRGFVSIAAGVGFRPG